MPSASVETTPTIETFITRREGPEAAERAEEEKCGQIRWLRTEYQDPEYVDLKTGTVVANNIKPLKFNTLRDCLTFSIN